MRKTRARRVIQESRWGAVERSCPSAVPRIIELIPELDNPRSSIVALEAFAEPSHHAAVGALVPLVEVLYQDRLRALAVRLSP